MNIDEQTLAKLQKLSSLRVDDNSKDKIIGDIEDVLSFVDNLNTLDISSIDATFTTIEGGTRLREDIPSKSDVVQDIMSSAPKSESNFFIVPKIIE
jgi:aspartyl-tRNA(Asn)/glutamyl-tRNA(Gln) amidotransferase subunit C